MGKIGTVAVLRLRATSAVSRDKSVRRSAQDDDFVGILTKNIQNKLALMGLRPVVLGPTYAEATSGSGCRAVVSHISRKTSAIWGTH